MNINQKQDQCTVCERHGQLVLPINSEMMIPENAPVRLLSAQLEELEYGKLYEADSSKGRKSATDPRVLFKVLVHGHLCGIYSRWKLEEALKKEQAQMLKTIGQLTLERDFLQAAFRQLEDRSPSFIKTNEALSVRRQCELLGIQRFTVYYKPIKLSAEQREYEECLMLRIDYWHTEMPYLGTRKMVQQLQKDGHAVGRKLVRRLMAQIGIHALYPKANLSKRNCKESIVPYLLRNKPVFLPNHVWSVDITYISRLSVYQREVQSSFEGTAHLTL